MDGSLTFITLLFFMVLAWAEKQRMGGSYMQHLVRISFIGVIVFAVVALLVILFK